MDSVSCVTDSFCAAVDDTGYGFVYSKSLMGNER
jgi:hypothetical protein